MTAPVSLAEIRRWAAKQMPVQCEYPHVCKTCGRGRAVLALVELAEAYLDVRDADRQPKGMGFGGFEHAQRLERLALAAKQVRL